MPKFHPLKIKEVRHETEECVSVAFEVPEALKPEYRFIQGQHLTLKTELDGEEVRRSYSICASPYDDVLRVAIKKLDGGRFSTFANEKLQAGDTLEVMTPMGRFFTELNPANAKLYVAFAAGSGITPILSIMKAVLQAEPKSEFTLFYGNRRTDTIIFHEEIEGLKNEYMGRLSVHHILSRELQGSELFSGRIDAEKCSAFCSKLIDPKEVDEYFLCGPESMIHDIRDTLTEMGVDKGKIHFELFIAGLNGKTQKKKETAKVQSVNASINITLDGNSFEFPLTSGNDTILEAALKAGANLPFACKGGVCCTCRAKLLEGEVEMDVNYALEPEEVEAGYILTCQSHPKTDRVVVDFDS
ncbi:MAG: phenylacetate-CoA oxygenase/reductase subunit PaaK [Lewinellaceae bacterium]|nr:phenylacetate-CoA oxygenase/reductase subunit PaaK [Lewinellaceae bacterium]